MKACLFDLDGTIQVGGQLAADALLGWRSALDMGYKAGVITNDCTSPWRERLSELQKLGLPILADQFWTPARTLARRLVNVDPDMIRCVGIGRGELDLPRSTGAKEARVLIVGDASTIPSEGYMEIVSIAESAQSVYCLNKNRFFFDGIHRGIDVGFWISGLEYCAGRQFELCGKPERISYYTAIEAMECSITGSVMIADAVEPDLIGAARAGIAGVLVASPDSVPQRWSGPQIGGLADVREALEVLARPQ